jgi:PPOX class probable F420-dependent enzyme
MMTGLPESARALVVEGRLAHVVTVNRDGSPQVSIVWLGIDGDELVSAHLHEALKVRNLRRDPRAVISMESQGVQPNGLQEHLIAYCTARVTEGGAAEMLQQLAHVYLGPEVRFPPVDDPPPGFVLRYAVDRIGGIGPWAR